MSLCGPQMRGFTYQGSRAKPRLCPGPMALVLGWAAVGQDQVAGVWVSLVPLTFTGAGSQVMPLC